MFVQMPFAGVERPSLALGLLTAALRAAGISTANIYANIAFAETIGLPAYDLIGRAAPHDLLGDWVFAESAFGESAPRAQEMPIGPGLFRASTSLIEAAVAEGGQADLRGLLLQLRRRACEFVDKLSAEILERTPKVVACTSMFDQHVASLALLQRIKQLQPEVITVIGGANCAGPMGGATHRVLPAVDFTVTGEFDQYVVGFFRALLAAEGDARRVDPLPPGVLGPHERRSGRAKHLLMGAPSSPPILTDLDSAPVPDYDDYFEQIYSSPIGVYVTCSLPFETSRGCWWGAKHHCTFCGLNADGMAFRKKSPARALAEIRTLTAWYGDLQCFATDNIIDMSYFQTVLPALAADTREYRIFYETKANLKREHVEALAAAGCYRIQPGIESLHDETLKIMKKGTTACANLQLLKYCLEFGITPAWSILHNFPGAEPQWVAEVAKDFVGLFHLPPPLGVFAIRFDRFSPYHERPEEYGLELAPMHSYRRIYPRALDDSVLMDAAYFFRDVREADRTVARHGRVADDMAKHWRDEFWSSNRPQLVIEVDDGESIRVCDTRSCARVGTHELCGRPATLLRILEAPLTHEGIHGRLRAMGSAPIDEGDLCELLDQLLERRLIWRSDTQYLALPTPQPRRPPSRERIGGDVHVGRYVRDHSGRNNVLVT